MLTTMLRKIPPLFFAHMRGQHIVSAVEAVRSVMLTYQMLPTSPRSLVFDEKDENRYLLMFTTQYCDASGVLDWDKVEHDALPSESAEALGMTGEVNYIAVCRAQAKLHEVLLKSNAGNDEVRDAAVDVRDAWIEYLREEQR